MLVAPVKVGDNSVTGAGSVVTRDVPPDSLVAGVPAQIKKNLRAEAEKEENKSSEANRGQWIKTLSDFRKNFKTLSKYSGELKEVAEKTTSEESILIVAHQIYHSV